jgi:hypothetical protein
MNQKTGGDSMARPKKVKYLVGDFETTVYEGQKNTEVWASAIVEMFTEDVSILHSIDETWEYLSDLKSNLIVYFHNLKFDGNFWISFFLNKLHLKQAYTGDGVNSCEWKHDKEMYNNTFKYTISEMGQWYSIKVKINNKVIEFRDSLKLLPFSVKEIGKAFKTKHQKLDMEYTGFRYAGCEIKPEEKKYIANDVLVVKEALEIVFQEGHNRLTIGSCCLAEYKQIVGEDDWKRRFPDVTQIELDSEIYGKSNVDAYVRKSYRGGWCYLVKGKENKIYTNGTTADVNSLYPSMMHSMSGNRYPVGKPMFWSGNYIPDRALQNNVYFFIRIRTKFYLKSGKLPFIQIKGNMLYKGTESLKTSDVFDKATGKYYDKYIDIDGNTCDTRVELTLTMTDYFLILEHYELVDFEILDGCYFYSEIGIFDEYIDKYAKIKMTSKGARRTLAKLFLNNLYGKMASSTDSSFKLAYVKDDNSIGFINITAKDKEAGYIPVGSAITSYARNFTIRAAQANYYGVEEHGFIYADTDSIHCDLPPEHITGIKVHETDFCAWKLESCWDRAIFARQKTYIEHVTHEDLQKIEEPYNNIKCAGMPQRCKDLFELSMSGKAVYEEYKENTPVNRFLFNQVTHRPIIRTFDDFKIGLNVPCKLIPKRIDGGVLLVESTYQMR